MSDEGQPPAAKRKRVEHEDGTTGAVNTSPKSASPHTQIYQRILDKLISVDSLKMFLSPVSDEEVPGYSRVIKHPIDLSTIQNRVNAHPSYYRRCSSPHQHATTERSEVRGADLEHDDEKFLDDLYLMLRNAFTFNEKGTKYYKHAKKMQKWVTDLCVQEGLVADTGEVEYIPTTADGKHEDNEKTLQKAEKECPEDAEEVMKGLQEDAEVPIDDLRAKLEKFKKEQEGKGEKKNSASTSTSSSSSSESSSEGSTSSSDSASSSSN